MYEHALAQAQCQTAALSPRQMQSVSILQMDLAQLEEYLNRQLEENPVIEQVDELPAAAPVRGEVAFRREYDGQDRLSALDFVPARDESEALEPFLRDQLERLRLPRWQVQLCLYIAGLLDRDGYLRPPEREALYQDLALPAARIDQAVARLQSLEPAGLAARDVRECLLLQLERLPGPQETAKEIVRSCLPELAQKRFAVIARKLRRPAGEVRRAAEQIMALDPRPGSGFSSSASVPYILPDIVVSQKNGRLTVTVNDRLIGRLQINREYAGLLEETDCPETRSYLREKLTQANWLLSCLDQRRSTLERCVRHIVALQPEFFLGRSGRLRPMTLADVARLAEVHESTVCRAVKGKYLVCDGGTFPLSYFFSNAVGGEASSQSVKSTIQILIRQEDKRAPLSDQQIQSLLEDRQGVSISRRTVAKYRTALRIPPAKERQIS